MSSVDITKKVVSVSRDAKEISIEEHKSSVIVSQTGHPLIPIEVGGSLIGEAGSMQFGGDGVTSTVKDGKLTVDVSSKITVANGQEPGSTSLKGDTLIFEGDSITADPNNSDVLIIGRTDTPSFDRSMFSSAIDHGYAADDQGIKSAKTTNGWWIFKDLKSVSGRPTGAIGDLIVFKNEIPTSNVALKHVFSMAIGQDRDLENKVWFMYRDGTQWTPWFSEQGADKKTIDNLTASVNELKSGNAAVLKELEALQTAAGNLYAPTKEAFNKAVTALINAALANYTPAKPGHGGDKPSLVFPRFYAQFSLGVPTDFTGATTSTNAEATLLRIPKTRERIFISVENDNDEASKVKGFKFNNKQEMSLAHRDIVRNGKKYRSFYTAGAFSEQKVDIKIDFGQGI
ncbi:hypothetical protein NVP1231O_22 [Vibrio phage 1.231.O._10N.261.49.F8]|nr:hypothetical protein NVP1119O_22 [Vibrio phage 1.119.O._10N.261.51.A9]AUR90394.1 hypothetical protein NVP1143O_22 [Vibrio phage 1.143.O._10N.261.55.C8]AUR96680.1 hypothetical protein NVP1231O_22 [Vibrio phage 1.231.O._10N.261.49.F8]